MPGIEHPQMDAIEALYTNRKLNPNLQPPTLVSTLPEFTPAQLHSPDNKSPNQGACAAAIRLGYFRDPSLAIRLLDAMDKYGHQSVTDKGYGWEAFAPDPHSLIWMGAMTCLLWQSGAKVQKLGDLHTRVVQYFADHCAGTAAFWTAGGIRIPCSRAKTGDGKPLQPTWTVDSQAYALITGNSNPGTLPKYGPDAKVIFDMLAECGSEGDFTAIRSAIKPAKVKLHIPIRRWDFPLGASPQSGGYLAALDHDEPANDRFSWLRVGGNGVYSDSGNSLSTMTTNLRQPDLIFGDPGGMSTGTGTGTGTTPAPSGPITPTPIPPDSPTATVDVSTFPARLSALRLAASDIPIRNRVIAQIPNATSATYRSLAAVVARFNIGAGQKQAPEWVSLIKDLETVGKG